jgi:hypothetical protein
VTHARDFVLPDPHYIYRQAQLRDEWAGEEPLYYGTSVRAAAWWLQKRGYIGTYLWTWDVDTLVNTLLHTGPVVVGTNWYESMDRPSLLGRVKVEGKLLGGHAYKVDGVNVKKETLRCKNSWGRGWGWLGGFTISFEDMARLMREDGEVCLATEIRREAA